MPKRLDPQQQKRTSLARAVKKFMREAPTILEHSEEPLYSLEQPGLGFWIGVKSLRQNQLFERFAKDHFKGFEKHTHSADNRAWVRFGYDYNGQVPEEVTPAVVRFKKATA